jgi:pantoate kinase
VNIAKYVRLRGLSLEAFQMAHTAEVTAGTGLGDVLAIYTGGCLVVRTRAGAPGVGEATGYPCPPLAAVTVHTKRIETAAMLRDLRTVLEAEGRKAVERAVDGDFYSFLETARRFSIAVGFLSKELDAELVKLKGAVGHYAKKGVLVVVAERDRADDVAERLRRRRLGPVKICELKSRAVSPL